MLYIANVIPQASKENCQISVIEKKNPKKLLMSSQM